MKALSSQAQAVPTPYPRTRTRRVVSNKVFYPLVISGGITLLAAVAAYMVVGGNWHIAAAMIFIPAALLVLHRYPYMGVVVWMLLAPFLMQTVTTSSRQIYWIIHRGLPVLTLGIAIVSSALNIRKGELPRLRLPEFAMLGYLLVSILSILLQNNDPMQTLIRFYDAVIIPMCLYGIVRISMPGKGLVRWLIPLAVFITVTQAGIGILSWIRPGLLPSAWLGYAGERATGSVNNPGVFTTTLVFGSFISLHTAMNMRSGWKRGALIGVFLLMIYGVFISYSRASWLMGAVMLMGVLLVYPRFVIRVMVILVPLALIGGLFIFDDQVQWARQRLESEEAENSALSRLPVLVAAYRMFQDKPIFGWGYDNFDRFDRRYQARFGDIANPVEKDLTSHNVYMTLLAEQGVIGTSLFLLPIFVLGWHTVQKYRFLPRQGWLSRRLLWLLWLVVLAYVIVNNFSPMVVVWGLGLYWLNLGLIASIVFSRKVVI
jgi:O-antigen ligase